MSPFPILLTRVLATPRALAALSESREGAHRFLARHLACDWSDLSTEEQRANTLALITGETLTSSYRTRQGVAFRIVTDPDRTSIRILLPEES